MKKFLKMVGLALGVAVALSMAEIERAATKYTAKGAEPTIIEGLSAADTQLIPNKNGTVIIRVVNGAEAIVATVVTPGEQGGNPVADLTNNIGANKIEIMGPFDPSVYNNSKGFIELKFDKVVGVKLEIIDASL